MSSLPENNDLITRPQVNGFTYIFGLFFQDYVHPLLPEVKEVHDGAENSESLLFPWRQRRGGTEEDLWTFSQIRCARVRKEMGKKDTYSAPAGRSEKSHKPSTWAETDACKQNSSTKTSCDKNMQKKSKNEHSHAHVDAYDGSRPLVICWILYVFQEWNLFWGGGK